MNKPLKIGIGVLTATAIIFGAKECSKLKVKLDNREEILNNVKMFTIKSVNDSLNINLNKEDSLLFKKYIDAYFRANAVKDRVHDLYVLSRDTNLFKSHTGNLQRDRVIGDIYNLVGNNVPDSINEIILKLNKNLSKYPEYKRFTSKFKMKIQDRRYESFSSFLQEKYVTLDKKLKLIKEKPIIKKKIPKPRSNLRLR